MARPDEILKSALLDEHGEPARVLAVAVLRQILTDAASPRQDIQNDIDRFVGRGGPAFWEGLLAVDHLAVMLARAIEERRRQQRRAGTL